MFVSEKYLCILAGGKESYGNKSLLIRSQGALGDSLIMLTDNCYEAHRLPWFNILNCLCYEVESNRHSIRVKQMTKVLRIMKESRRHHG